MLAGDTGGSFLIAATFCFILRACRSGGVWRMTCRRKLSEMVTRETSSADAARVSRGARRGSEAGRRCNKRATAL